MNNKKLGFILFFLQFFFIILKRLTAEVNNIDYFVAVVPVQRWDILGSKGTISSQS